MSAAIAAAPLWAGIRGQDAAVARLQRAVLTDRVAHAYAFVGPAGVGRRMAALALAQACLCAAGGCGRCDACGRVAAGHHPDCQVLAPTPPPDNPRGALALRIEQIRELEHAAALAPLLGPRKVFVLDDADRMTPPTAHALLKTLEEPPPRTLLILIVANPRALPPTVLSRCQVVRFRPLAETDAVTVLEARGADSATARLLARLCRGQVGLAVGADPARVRAERETALALLAAPPAQLGVRLDEVQPDRAAALACLETWGQWYRDALCLAAGGPVELLVHLDRADGLTALARRATVPGLCAALDAVREAHVAVDGNVNPRLALERTLLALASAGAAAA